MKPKNPWVKLALEIAKLLIAFLAGGEILT